MALVTLQRSPSPSNDPDEESGEGADDGTDGRSSTHRKRSRSTMDKLRKIFSTVRFINKLRPCLSESYFTIKGAALILPHSDLNRKTSRKNHGGEIQRHLQSMLHVLRPEDQIKVAIRLENQQGGEHRYMALVSTMGRQDTEECVILGMDCSSPSPPTPTPTPTSPTTPSTAIPTTTITPSTPPTSPTTGTPGAGASVFETRGISTAVVGLVLPIWMGLKVGLRGDGGFAISQDDKSYLFKPVSVQAMWSAIQSMEKALNQAEQNKYLPEGLTHTWVEYYRSKLDRSNHTHLTSWHVMEDVSIFAPANLTYSNENEQEKVKLTISAKLKDVMMTVDLDEATCRSLRLQVERELDMKLDQYRNYFDEELIRILGQMDSPSRILDHLYLGSEWNASNLDELQQLGIKYILNISREIDNFFTGMFHYYNVRLYDEEESDLLKHWPKTYKFINKARKHNSKVLVHCKMGISRSASTVMAYIMKENRWQLDEAYTFVKERRNCVMPNKGFMEQLHTYEGILNASNKRDIFRSQSDHIPMETAEGEEGEASQQGMFLGESLFKVMSGPDWVAPLALTPEEEILRQKSGDYPHHGMEHDFETDSRSADSMEESLPDIPSPISHQPPSSFLFHDTAPKTITEDIARPTPPLLTIEPPGSHSRIKPDTSWIKLEPPGESSTDEAMEVREGEEMESDSKTCEMGQADSEATSVKFVLGSGETSSNIEQVSSKFQEAPTKCQEASPSKFQDPPSKFQDPPSKFQEAPSKIEEVSSKFHEVSSKVEVSLKFEAVTSMFESASKIEESKDVNIADPNEDTSTAEPPTTQKGNVSDMGVHQYYNREQIPWNPGKVRNLLEGFKSDGQSIAADVKDAGSECAISTNQNALDSEKVEIDSASCKVRSEECPRVGSPTEKCGMEEGGGSEEDVMDGDELIKSVYELEDIQLTPGTVQRTRQEIEERHKQDEADTMKSVKRTSSLREERETSKSRNSERRKTCTPIVSPPPEKEEEVEGVGEKEVDLEAALLRLNKEERRTEEEMEEDAGKEGSQVTVYTFGEETVPVKAGIVQRQKQEIENKSMETSTSHQRSLSLESTGSVCSIEDAGHRSPHHQPITASTDNTPSPSQTDASQHAHNIPVSRHLWSPHTTVHTAKGTSPTKHHTDASPSTSPKTDSDSVSPQHLGSKEFFIEGVRGDVKATGAVFDRLRCSSDSDAEDHRNEASLLKGEVHSPFRPYAHSSPSSKKQTGKGHYDPETLAMIREIGSAFVSCPPVREDEENQGGTSLVKHLVKNIEKENKRVKSERKIVIIDSSVSQGKKRTKTEPASSLFTPSPEIMLNIEKNLSQTLPSSSPIAHPTDITGHSDARRASLDVSEIGFKPCSDSPAGVDRSSSEHLPSVVRHLRGKFESHGPYLDTEVEVPETLESTVTACSSLAVDSEGGGVVMRGRDQGVSPGKEQGISSSARVTKSKSMEEQNPGDVAKFPCHGAGEPSTEPSYSTRRPRSAEDVPPHSSAFRASSSIPRVQAPWNRDVAAASQQEDVSEGVKVRRLHGKSHPLSRLQQQGEGSCPAIQRHSPFHSSM